MLVSLQVLSAQWYFGRVKWTNSAGQTLNQAIAINNEQVSTPLLQAQVSDVDANTKSLNLMSENVSDNSSLDIELELTGAAAFVDNSLIINNAGQFEVTTQTEQLIKLTAQVSSGSAGISSGTPPVVADLSQNSSITPIVCDVTGDTDGCDEVIFEVPFNFKHYGQDHTSLLINDNGIVIAGSDIAQVNLATNKRLPSSDQPDNVIAPFWADFDMSNPNLANDTGGGDFLVANAERDGERYLVVQWDKVKLYMNDGEGFTPSYWGISSADLEFTFQLILQENSENKWFRYLNVPEQPNFYSVGVENGTGSSGFTYWFDGTGTGSVNSNDALAVNVTEGSALQLSVNMQQTDESNFAANDTFTVAEDNSVNFNVLANDIASPGDAFLQVEVADANYVEQLFNSDVDVSLSPSSLAITEQPQNGQVSILSGGVVSYVPEANFAGEDSFVYRITNSAEETATATATVVVTPVNDAPSISAITGPDSVESGASASFSVSATDIDSSNLTYSWSLPAQLTSTNLTSNQLNFTAQSVSQDTQVEVTVTVTDGVSSVSTSKQITVTAANNTGGGSTGGNTSTPTPNNASNDGGSSGGSLGYGLLVGLLGLRLLRKK